MTKKQPPKPPSKALDIFRLGFLSILTAVAMLSVTAYSAVNWTHNQALDTDNWTNTMSSVLDNEIVTESLGRFITSKVFDQADIEKKVKDALPERAAFLAQPLTDQLQSLTTNATTSAVRSDAFQSIWTTANRTVHSRIVDSARSDNSSEKPLSRIASLDLSGIRARISERLGTSSEVVPEQNNRAVEIRADLQTKAENIRKYIRASDFLYATLPALILASILASLALSNKRRLTLIIISTGTLILALLQLIGLRALRPVVLNRIQDSSYRPAVDELYKILVGTFNQNVYIVLGLSALVLAVCVALGIKSITKFLNKYAGITKLGQTSFYKKWREFSTLVGTYKPHIWGALAIIVLVALAFAVEVTWRSGTNTVLLLISSISLVQLLAVSSSKK